MNWIETLQESIHYVEGHLREEGLNTEAVARNVAVSPFYFQKCFSLITGLSVGEYIRNRKLYLAAMDLVVGKKVIDVALDYGYESPDSFTKAFCRFHGISPSQLNGDTSKIRVFLPLKITISVTGGNTMNYQVEQMKEMKLIGFKKEFDNETSYKEIPAFWTEIFENYEKPLFMGQEPQNDMQQAIVDYKIGMFGVCLEGKSKTNHFDYLIAGEYKGGKVPEGLEVVELPAMTWAKFECVGPMPGALQSVNTAIFKEWLPTNGKYEMAGGYNIEWYSPEGSTKDMDYKSAIWIPVIEQK